MSALPNRVEAFRGMAQEVGAKHGVAPCFLLAVADRESYCTLSLRPKTSAGCGDWKPRHWARYSEQPGALLRYKKSEGTDPKTGQPVTLCFPIDDQGWGRGIMQIDWADPDNFEFLDKRMDDGSPAWADARENMEYGAKKLARLIQVFSNDEGLAAAAYNAGAHAVWHALHDLTEPADVDTRHAAADFVTTGHNYLTDVMQRRTLFRRDMAVISPQPPE